MTKRSAEREQFLADIITTAVEGGIGYWSTASEYVWDCPPADAYTVIHEMQDEPVEGGVEKVGGWFGPEYYGPGIRIGIKDIARAISTIVVAGDTIALAERNRKLVAAASAANDAGDIDSDAADWIVQVAALGDVIYG